MFSVSPASCLIPGANVYGLEIRTVAVHERSAQAGSHSVSPRLVDDRRKWIVRAGIIIIVRVICSVGERSAAADAAAEVHFAQGIMSGEVTSNSVLLQARLTAAPQPDQQGEFPGIAAEACFEYSPSDRPADITRTPWLKSGDENDFIVRTQVAELQSGTEYRFRVIARRDGGPDFSGPSGTFRTLFSSVDRKRPETNKRESSAGVAVARTLRFCMGSCMNYHAFMHGESMKHSGPLTATPEDRRAGYPSFAAMKERSPDFFIGAGDLVYYDATIRGNAVTVPEMRRCWHEQFHQARIRDFLAVTPAYWLKDDHDFRYNDADLTGDRQPTAATGIQLFQEQMPVHPTGDLRRPGYRTHLVHPRLQLWMTEGRDHRSANRSDDGPKKTLWGSEQREWLKETLLKSPARWKIIVSPTPMIGPDDGKKKDNHADLKGFQHERDEFFSWLADHSITGVMIFCGDRHWQFHSVHPSGIEEFGCGALNDENSRLGVAPGDPDGSDPEGKIRQLFMSPEESGGFLLAECTPASDGEFRLTIALCDDHGKILHQSEYHDSLSQGQTGPIK